MYDSRILYIEPFLGISGDMFVGALLDLGVDFDHLRQQLLLLPLRGYQLRHSQCLKSGIRASKFDVLIGEDPGKAHGHHDEHGHGHSHGSHHNRSFGDIREMISASSLSRWVQERSVEAFAKLAEAEGKIHAQPPDRVHFHEVGAIDSIVDIVGTMIAVEALSPAKILSAAINVGQGTIKCQHGIYPVPGPATLELLRDVPTFNNSVQGELTTPTGAALLVTLAQHFGARPTMNVKATGYGAGTLDTPGGANVLRVTLGEEITQSAELPAVDEVIVVEADIDDMSPQLFGHFQEKALEAGALDVSFVPIQMKKNRPAVRLTLICGPNQLDEMARLIFLETTTIGIRYTTARRKTLMRDFIPVQTEFGQVMIKKSSLDGGEVNFIPEYEDCHRLALEKGIPLKTIQAAAFSAYMDMKKSQS
jgi:pyridinium-3,5-bisthiocarboxylic acid mononucleotide nickel chelatase